MRFVGNLILFIGAACLTYLASWNAYDLIAQTGANPAPLSTDFFAEFGPAYAAAIGLMVLGALVRLKARAV